MKKTEGKIRPVDVKLAMPRRMRKFEMTREQRALDRLVYRTFRQQQECRRMRRHFERYQ